MMERIDRYGEYEVTPEYVREIYGDNPTQIEIRYYHPDGTITDNKDPVDLDQVMQDAEEITLVQVASYKFEQGLIRAYKGEGCTQIYVRTRKKKRK